MIMTREHAARSRQTLISIKFILASHIPHFTSTHTMFVQLAFSMEILMPCNPIYSFTCWSTLRFYLFRDSSLSLSPLSLKALSVIGVGENMNIISEAFTHTLWIIMAWLSSKCKSSERREGNFLFVFSLPRCWGDYGERIFILLNINGLMADDLQRRMLMA
jgi:hypothetical protein